MNSQFGLINLWTQGDLITKGSSHAAPGDVACHLDGDHHQGAGPAQDRGASPVDRKLLARRRLRRWPQQAGNRPVQPVPRPRARRPRSDGASPCPAAVARLAGRERMALAQLAQFHRRIHGPAAIRTGRAGLGGFDRALHRPVRHRLGHLPRADIDQRGRTGHHRQGGGPDRRSADHDGAGPGGGHSRGAGLQRPGARQQGHPEQAQPLLARPALLFRDRRTGIRHRRYQGSAHEEGS